MPYVFSLNSNNQSTFYKTMRFVDSCIQNLEISLKENTPVSSLNNCNPDVRQQYLDIIRQLDLFKKFKKFLVELAISPDRNEPIDDSLFNYNKNKWVEVDANFSVFFTSCFFRENSINELNQIIQSLAIQKPVSAKDLIQYQFNLNGDNESSFKSVCFYVKNIISVLETEISSKQNLSAYSDLVVGLNSSLNQYKNIYKQLGVFFTQKPTCSNDEYIKLKTDWFNVGDRKIMALFKCFEKIGEVKKESLVYTPMHLATKDTNECIETKVHVAELNRKPLKDSYHI